MKSNKDHQRSMKTAMSPAAEKLQCIAERDAGAYHSNATSSANRLEIKKEPFDNRESSEDNSDGTKNMIEIEIQFAPQQPGVEIPFHLQTTPANKNIIKPSLEIGAPNIVIKEEKDLKMKTVVKIEPVDEDDISKPHSTVPTTQIKLEPPDESLPESEESITSSHIHEVPCTTTGERVFKVKIKSDNIKSTSHYVNEAKPTTKPVDSLQNLKKKKFKGTCTSCSKKFNSQTLLKKHICSHKKSVSVSNKVTVHTEEITYKCHICDKKFDARRGLIRHVRRHPEEKPFKCDVCNIGYVLKNDLEKHMITHTEKEPFKCDVCNKLFIRKTYLTNHKRIHTGERPYDCCFCTKNFVQKSTFIRHVRTHTGEKPYNCVVCEKTFASNGELHIHVRMHSGDKPYKCDTCLKTFSTKSHYNNHARTHTGVKPHGCDICHKRFNTSTLRNAHIKVHNRSLPTNFSGDELHVDLEHHS